MSFAERFIVQYPYFGGSTVGGSIVVSTHTHTHTLANREHNGIPLPFIS